jgi:hypothetical protein
MQFMLVTMDEMWEKGRESGSAKARKMEGLQGLNLFPMRLDNVYNKHLYTCMV